MDNKIVVSLKNCGLGYIYQNEKDNDPIDFYYQNQVKKVKNSSGIDDNFNFIKMDESFLNSILNKKYSSKFDNATKNRSQELINITNLNSDISLSSPTMIEANIKGSSNYTYHTRVSFFRNTFFSTCSCPVGSCCKHAFALLEIVNNKIKNFDQEETYNLDNDLVSTLQKINTNKFDTYYFDYSKMKLFKDKIITNLNDKLLDKISLISEVYYLNYTLFSRAIVNFNFTLVNNYLLNNIKKTPFVDKLIYEYQAYPKYIDNKFFSILYDYFIDNYKSLLYKMTNDNFFYNGLMEEILNNIEYDENNSNMIVQLINNNSYEFDFDKNYNLLVNNLPKKYLKMLILKNRYYFADYIAKLPIMEKLEYLTVIEDNKIDDIVSSIDINKLSEEEKLNIIKKLSLFLINNQFNYQENIVNFLLKFDLAKYTLPFYEQSLSKKMDKNKLKKVYDNVFKNDELFYDEFNKIFTYNFILKEDVYDYHNYEIVFKCCLEDKNIFSCSFEKDGKFKNEENFLTFKNDFFNSFIGKLPIYCNDKFSSLMDQQEKIIKKNDLNKLISSFVSDASFINESNVSLISNSLQSINNGDFVFYFYTDNVYKVKFYNGKKEYVIKDLREFLNNFDNNELYRFSKTLSFCCNKNNLSSHGKKMFSLLKKIDLYSDFIDEEVFKDYLNILNKNDVISFNEKRYYFTKENKQIEYYIDEDHLIKTNPVLDFTNLMLFNDFAIYFDGASKEAYTFDEINYSLFWFFTKYQNLKIDLDEKILNAFIKNVYLTNKNEIKVLDENLVKEINVDRIELYFDYDEKKITVEEKIYQNNILLDKDRYLYVSSYQTIKMFLEQLGFINNEIVDEEKVYKFLLSDLSLLNKLAIVYLSDSIKNSKIRSFEKQKYHISYNNNLMDVFLENSSFSEEELEQIYKSLKRKKSFIRLKDNTILSLDNDNAREFYEVTTDLHLDPKKLKEKKTMPIYNRFKLINLENDYPLDQYMEEVISSISSFKEKQNNLPSYQYELKPYQKEAVNWLLELKKYHFSGILADDMGLGKTFEMLSFYDLDKEEAPSLIVCPKSLIFNWINEINKFVPHTIYQKIFGTSEERKNIINNIALNKRCLYLTSYDSLRNDIELYKKIKFRYVILDEAQAIKTFTSKKSISTKLLSSEYRFVLTGTPIENNVLELWSIFDFLMPGYFEEIEEFKSRFETDESYKEIVYKKISLFILRRTKKETLKDLPDKFERVISTELTSEQKKIYDSYCLEAKKIFEENNNVFSMLPFLTRLRQICVEPRTFIKNYQGDSAKINLLNLILDEYLPQGRKILIFSQFVEVLKLIGEDLNKKNVPYYMLTGETKAEVRLTLCNNFNDENSLIKVFLISIKAGGSGLNLIGADTVIHMDIWWNQAVEDQATDRTYRIGQKKNVEVIKLMCENTIEEKIIELQNKKKDLIDSLISKDDKSITSMSQDDIKFILG